MINRAFAKTYSSNIAPSPEMNVIWMDLNADPYGSILKYWNGTTWTVLSSDTTEIVNNLTSGGTTKALSAEQGKVLNQAVEAITELNGTNYLMVYGTGNPTQNAAELQAAYEEAKNMPRYLGDLDTSGDVGDVLAGQTFYDTDTSTYKKVIETLDGFEFENTTEAEAKSVRTTVIVAPGVYDFGDDTLFELGENGINIVSLTGNADVVIDYIAIMQSYTLIKGINAVNSFTVADENSTQIFENCIAGEFSFSPNVSFAGKAINCIGGNGSFRGSGGTFTGILENCTLTSGTFPTPTGAGKIYNCIDGNGNLVNYPSVSGTDYVLYLNASESIINPPLKQLQVFTVNSSFNLSINGNQPIGTTILFKKIGDPVVNIRSDGETTIDAQDVDTGTGTDYILSGAYAKITLYKYSETAWLII